MTHRREHLELDTQLERRQGYEVTKKVHCGMPDGLQTHQGLVRSSYVLRKFDKLLQRSQRSLQQLIMRLA